jgi:hypothetical protein
MKKVKFVLIALAIVLSIGGAFATRPALDCRFYPQFYWTSGGFVPAGQEGVDYICAQAGGVCSWVQSGNGFVACQTGVMER